MRTHPRREMESGRVVSGHRATTQRDGCQGAFDVRCPETEENIHVVASDGLGWDHVSVSVPCQRRCPTWEEMAWVKAQFWRDDETVIEFHPPKHLYVNQHPYCLHLWLPQGVEIPVPPMDLVGV